MRAPYWAPATLPLVFAEVNIEKKLAEILHKPPQSFTDKDRKTIEKIKNEWARLQDRWTSSLLDSKNDPQDYLRVTELVNFLQQAVNLESSPVSKIERKLNILHQVSERPVLERLARYVDDWNDKFSPLDEQIRSVGSASLSLHTWIKRRFLDYVRMEGGSIEGEKYSYLSAPDSQAMYEEYIRLIFDTAQSGNWLNPPETFHTAEYVLDWYRQQPNADYLNQFFEQYRTLSNQEKDKSIVHPYLEIFAYYGSHHAMTESSAQALWTNVLPRLRARDETVAPLIRETDKLWAVTSGEFGIADFYCHALVAEAKPARLAELQLILQEIPTSNYYALRQNRQDAIDLEDQFPIREVIHDQRPIVHKLMSAMVRYGSTEEASVEEESAKNALKQVVDQLDEQYGSSETLPELFDKERYQEEFFDPMTDEIRTVLDVLKRLEKNTKPIPESPPEVFDLKLQKMLRKFPRYAGMKEETKKESLLEVLQYVNGILNTWYEEKSVGIHPQYVPVLAWLERQCTEQMRRMTYEEQMSFLHAPFWLEILKFHHLTWSGSEFKLNNFNTWLETLKILPVQEAMKAISQHISKDQGKLANELRQRGYGRMTGALWSGNLARELMHLFEMQPPVTSYGQTHRRESLTGGGRGD